MTPYTYMIRYEETGYRIPFVDMHETIVDNYENADFLDMYNNLYLENENNDDNNINENIIEEYIDAGSDDGSDDGRDDDIIDENIMNHDIDNRFDDGDEDDYHNEYHDDDELSEIYDNYNIRACDYFRWNKITPTQYIEHVKYNGGNPAPRNIDRYIRYILSHDDNDRDNLMEMYRQCITTNIINRNILNSKIDDHQLVVEIMLTKMRMRKVILELISKHQTRQYMRDEVLSEMLYSPHRPNWCQFYLNLNKGNEFDGMIRFN